MRPDTSDVASRLTFSLRKLRRGTPLAVRLSFELVTTSESHTLSELTVVVAQPLPRRLSDFSSFLLDERGLK